MLAAMDADRIAALLEPFLGGTPLSPKLAAQLQAYLALLLRWNARINLTTVRDPEQIVTRHFGESLFAARLLRDAGAFTAQAGNAATLADVGSGAGFPGIPTKLFVPEVATHPHRIAEQEGHLSARGHPHTGDRRCRSVLRSR